MHHPTDVIGGMANGALSLLIVGLRPVHRQVRGRRPLATDRAHRRDRRGRGARAGSTAVVFNPTVTGEAAREKLRRILEQHGHRAPAFVETTA